MSEIEPSQIYLPKFKKKKLKRIFINPQQFQNLVVDTKNTQKNRK